MYIIIKQIIRDKTLYLEKQKSCIFVFLIEIFMYK